MSFSAANPDPLLNRTCCAHCARLINASTDLRQKTVGQGKPDPGDYTMCAWCGAFLIFEAESDDHLTTRVLDPDGEIPAELISLHYAWSKAFSDRVSIHVREIPPLRGNYKLPKKRI